MWQRRLCNDAENSALPSYNTFDLMYCMMAKLNFQHHYTVFIATWSF